VSKEVSYLVTSLFLCGYILGPVLWGPGSELLGRRPIFILTMTVFTLLHLGQALAPNIQTVLATRFFAGVFGVAPLSNCGGMPSSNTKRSRALKYLSGVIVDIWPTTGRGPSTALFTASVFWGSALGPVVGGLYAP
jgi:MFS family permease